MGKSSIPSKNMLRTLYFSFSQCSASCSLYIHSSQVRGCVRARPRSASAHHHARNDAQEHRIHLWMHTSKQAIHLSKRLNVRLPSSRHRFLRPHAILIQPVCNTNSDRVSGSSVACLLPKYSPRKVNPQPRRIPHRTHSRIITLSDLDKLTVRLFGRSTAFLQRFDSLVVQTQGQVDRPLGQTVARDFFDVCIVASRTDAGRRTNK